MRKTLNNKTARGLLKRTIAKMENLSWYAGSRAHIVHANMIALSRKLSDTLSSSKGQTYRSICNEAPSEILTEQVYALVDEARLITKEYTKKGADNIK